jgi:TatD DNase family protein
MLINIHTHKQTTGSQRAIVSLHEHFEICAGNGQYSVGFHPWYLHANYLETHLSLLKKYSILPNVLAIGECGLDKVSTTDFQLQLGAFSLQIDWANEIKKPLIIHCVRAHNETLLLLRERRVNVPVIFHGFNKNAQIANQILDAGFYLSFGKSLMKEEMEDVFKEVPMNRFFLETDNSVFSIEQIYTQAAKIKNSTVEMIEAQIETTASNIFGPSIIQ